MPNHCSNSITVVVPKEKRDSVESEVKELRELFADVFAQRRGFFNSIIPQPQELADTHSGSCNIDGKVVHTWRIVDGKEVEVDTADLISRFGAANWYDWNSKNWGTKWDAYDIDLTQDWWKLHKVEDGAVLRIKFDSAWSPPTPVIEKLSERYPDLIFIHACCEQGCELRGLDRWIGGVCVEAQDLSGDMYEPNENEEEDSKVLPEVQAFLDLHGIELGG